MKYVFDIEADHLYERASKIWMLVMEDTETGEVFKYSDYDNSLESLSEGLKRMSSAKILAGHNICGYDLPVLKKLTGWEPSEHTQVWDTWIMSQVNQYNRSHKHGLEGWGERLGYPKLHFDNFSRYSQEMLTYCIRDVNLNTKVYKILVQEASSIAKRYPLYMEGLRTECAFATIEADIRIKGWLFDMPAAKKLLAEFYSKMAALESEIEPAMGMVCKNEDPKSEFKKPQWIKNGNYAQHTARWFNVAVESGKDEATRLIEGDYCRVYFEKASISSDTDLKSFLFAIGWEPDEYNGKWEGKKWVQTSPKLTESSLELLEGHIGQKIREYNSMKNRRGILNGWIANAEADGRLHGKMWTIGTPSFRCRHEVVANLPSVEALYGKEMRSLLICEPGTVIVGADSSGNQMRGLCHYIGNEDFTNEVINGDVHQRNADTLTEVYPTPRKTAKPWLYA